MNRLVKPAYAALLAGSLLLGAGSAAAQLSAAIDAGERATRKAVQTQKRINQLDDERSEMVRSYRDLLQKKKDAQLAQIQLRREVESQRREKESKLEQLTRTDEIKAQVLPMMNSMADATRALYENDLPFKELSTLRNGDDLRALRIQGLTETMNNPDVAAAEKYRYIIETLQAEMNYGRTLDAYDQTIEIDGAEQTVTVMRWGRIGMAYVTKDGDKAGIYDRESDTWQPLPASYIGDIRRSIKVAKAQLPAEVLSVPVKLFTVE